MRLGVRKWKNFSVIFSVEAKLTNFCVSTWHSKIIYGLDVKLSVTSFLREVSFARGKFDPIWIMAFVGLMSNLAKWKAIARRAVWGHCGAKLNFLKYCVKIYKTVTKFTWFEAILKKKSISKARSKTKPHISNPKCQINLISSFRYYASLLYLGKYFIEGQLM